MEKKTRYIYVITNLINQKTYIGQHSNIPDDYMGTGLLISKAYNKYGKENFKKDYIIIGNFTRNEINELERYYIWLAKAIGKAEYNIAKGGYANTGGSPKGVKRTKEFKENVSKFHSGRKRPKSCGEKISKTRIDRQIGKNVEPWNKNRTDIYSKETINNIKINTKESMKKVPYETLAYWKDKKDYVYWNNGLINKRSNICPEGFIRGKLKKS